MVWPRPHNLQIAENTLFSVVHKECCIYYCNLRTYLNLKKQRFFCKSCNSSFIAKTSIVEENCFISDNTKTKAFIKSAEAQSLTDIAKDCDVSPTTVQRIINKEAKVFKLHYRALPKHLSFDEFKYAKGKMAFEYIDAETGDILDILEGRDSRTVKNH